MFFSLIWLAMFNKSFFYYVILLFLSLLPITSFADIVKPALVEISVKTDGTFQIELRASIEALLTGINSRYKNTKDAPNAQAYDDLRVLPPEQLRQAFRSFENDFLQEAKIAFEVDSQNCGLPRDSHHLKVQRSLTTS